MGWRGFFGRKDAKETTICENSTPSVEGREVEPASRASETEVTIPGNSKSSLEEREAKAASGALETIQEESSETTEPDKGLALAILHFLILEQETRLKGSNLFVGVYSGEEDWNGEKDWKENHYMKWRATVDDTASGEASENDKNKKDRDHFAVLLDSYGVSPKSLDTEHDPIAINSRDEKGNDALIVLCTDYRHFKKAILPCDENSAVHECLARFREKLVESQELEKDTDLYKIAANLDPKRINEISDEETRAFVSRAIAHKLFQALEPLRKNLLKCSDQKTVETMVGFGQLRIRNVELEKIVNGPLFEVPVIVDQEGKNTFAIRVKDGAKARLNQEVFSNYAEMSGMEKSKFGPKLKKLICSVERIRVEDLLLGKKESYSNFINDLEQLLHGVVSNSVVDADVHSEIPPIYCNFAVLTSDAWCLFTRKNSSTKFSRDAEAIANSIRNGEKGITETVKCFVRPDVVNYNASVPFDESKMRNLPMPLRSNFDQKMVSYRLLIENVVMQTVRGPPGVGKTQSIVNVVAGYLSHGKRILCTSSNQRALDAMIQKLPNELRVLCTPLSSCEDKEEGSLLELEKHLEELIDCLRDANQNKEKHAEKVKELQNDLTFWKHELAQLGEADHAARKTDFDVLQDESLVEILILIGEVNEEKLPGAVYPVLFENALASFDTLNQLDPQDRSIELPDAAESHLDSLIRHSSVQVQRALSDGKIPIDKDPDDLKDILSALRVDGKPSGQFRKQEWVKVQHELERKKEELHCHQSLNELGCSACGGHQNFGKLKRLKDTFDKIPFESQQKLKIALNKARSADCKATQVKRKTILGKVEKIESKLVLERVFESLGNKFQQKELGGLQRLLRIVKNSKSKALQNGKKAGSDFTEIKTVLKEVSGCFPFIAATCEQVSDFLPPSDLFDCAVIDEASQSDYTALLVLFRCKQCLVVGDDRQAGPDTSRLKHSWIEALVNILPTSAYHLQDLLKPGVSFFDIFEQNFTIDVIQMTEHFRCNRDIANNFSELFYSGKLKPMRLQSKDNALIDVPVDTGKKTTGGEHKDDRARQTSSASENGDPVIKTVQQRLQELVDTMRNHAEARATIGIIAMDGGKQVTALKKVVKELQNDWVDTYNDREFVVDLMINVGECKWFQSSERDIIFIVSGEGIKEQSGPEWNRKWNVALSRAKERIYNVRPKSWSTTRKLDWKFDIRFRILECFKKRDIQSTSEYSPPKQPKGMSSDIRDLWEKSEKLLVSEFWHLGYNVFRNKGDYWSHALQVSVNDSPGDVLICFEDCVRSEEQWKELLKQQESFEGAGRHLLRISLTSLTLDFQNTFEKVKAFLETTGLNQPNAKRPPLGSDEGSNKKTKTAQVSTMSAQGIVFSRAPDVASSAAKRQFEAATEGIEGDGPRGASKKTRSDESTK